MRLIEVEVKDSGLTDLLVMTKLRGMDMRSVMESIGAALKEESRLNFISESGPDGKWKPLSRATIQRRKKKGRGAKILRDTSRLFNSITYRADSGSVVIGTNVEYAAVQHFGATIKRAAKKQTLYFSRNKSGEVGRRFVKKEKSNFAQDVNVAAHDIVIPVRRFFPITASGELSKGAKEEVIKLMKAHFEVK